MKLLKKHNIKLNEDNLMKFVDSSQENLHSLAPLDLWEQLEITMDLLKIDSETQIKVKERWYSLGEYNISKFAPYTVNFQRVLNTYAIGTAARIFGTRQSNLIDIEYLLYLPFCFVFCTGDNFQYQIAKMVNTGSQYILKSEELKNELKLIADYNSGKENVKDFVLPSNSLAKRIIDEYMILEKKVEGDSLDFMTLESYVSIFSPCPCGSGKKLKDCCYEKIIKGD